MSLLAVDHPTDVKIVVDERFIPNTAPDNQVLTVSTPQPLGNVIDHRSSPLDEVLRAVDGNYADRFTDVYDAIDRVAVCDSFQEVDVAASHAWCVCIAYDQNASHVYSTAHKRICPSSQPRTSAMIAT